jgi:hypothetical protein
VFHRNRFAHLYSSMLIARFVVEQQCKRNRQ